MGQRVIFPAFLISLIGCFGAGCMSNTHTSGRAIADDKVTQIVKGKTTTDEIISLFGAPQSTSEMAGMVLYVYRYEQSKQDMGFLPYYTRGKGSTTSDELTISFDKAAGTVRTYSLQRGIKGS